MRLLLALTILSLPAAAQGVIDRVAVVVGTTVITESEVLQEARLTALLNQEPLDVGPAARRAAAERLVDQQLIRNEMRIGAYPPPSGAEIDEMLANLKREHSLTDAQFRAALDKYGVTEEKLRRHLSWQLSALRFTDVRFSGGAGIPAGEDRSANRATTPPANVDQQMENWLKQTRAATKIQFKPGAFQ